MQNNSNLEDVAGQYRQPKDISERKEQDRPDIGDMTITKAMAAKEVLGCLYQSKVDAVAMIAGVFIATLLTLLNKTIGMVGILAGSAYGIFRLFRIMKRITELETRYNLQNGRKGQDRQ